MWVAGAGQCSQHTRGLFHADDSLGWAVPQEFPGLTL